AVMLCVQPVMALDNAGSVEGVVKNAAGQPVTGAFVRLKNAEKRLTFMVVSQNQGAFTAKDLPPGKYTAQAIGGTNQSAVSAPVDDWTFTVKRMRVNMAAASLPDITDQDANTIVGYLSSNFKPLPGGDDINGRLPTTLATGDSLKYRVVTLDLPRRYSEPHDIASDPSGLGWAAERAGFFI